MSSRYGAYEDNPAVAESYDLVPQYTARGDIDFYLSQCDGVQGKMLELGCGTGRVLIKIARTGKSVTGVDLSEHMLAVCRKNLSQEPPEVRERVSIVQANMAEFELGEKFDLAIIPFRALQHLVDVKEQVVCLERVGQHLKPGGRLVFDVFQVNLNYLVNPPAVDEVEDVAETELSDGRRLRRTHRVLKVHRAEQYSDVELIYYVTGVDGKTERLAQAFPMRFFFRYELEHLLVRCGFKVKQIYGNFDGTRLTDSSPEMIFVAERNS